MAVPIPTLPADQFDVPDALARLKDLAFNTWWTWHRDARELFEKIDPEMWTQDRNPVRLLLESRAQRLEELANDYGFLAELAALAERFDADTSSVEGIRNPITYVSAEYALHESLPIYSGGLGVLSGDHLKSAADLALPLMAVGLFYRRGYFRQLVDADGYQQHFYPDLDPHRLPLLRVADEDGKHLKLRIALDNREVVVAVWVVMVGRVPLILLDTDVAENPAEDRFITSQLYVRGREMRFEQELVLGRGAVAVMDALRLAPRAYHMNEGHSAFLALENARRSGVRGLDAAVATVRDRHVFTTHTPVPAGNEVFETDLVRPYLDATARDIGCSVDDILALGHSDTSHTPGFNMTALALRMSTKANGVSQLHGDVSRKMWPGFDISGITNGIHVATWLGPEMATVLGADGNSDPAELAVRAEGLSDEALWAAHLAQKHRLMRFVRVRSLRQLARHGKAPAALRSQTRVLDPAALTIGFARRFASYKRADLLFHDMPRLERLLTSTDKPVQVLMAGKAHPADRAGQDMIQRVCRLAGSDSLRGRVVFVEDYDMSVARLMVRGVDVWLNNPEWPHEASGTSGMKAAANGVLHASVPDGWWAEAADDARGFTIGAPELPEVDRDNDTLLRTFEEQVVPIFFDDRDAGIPRAWVAMMRSAMSAYLYTFSTRRMVSDYAAHLYDL